MKLTCLCKDPRGDAVTSSVRARVQELIFMTRLVEDLQHKKTLSLRLQDWTRRRVASEVQDTLSKPDPASVCEGSR